MTKTPDFDKADFGLNAFHVAEHDGFAFLSFDEDPPAIEDWLGDFSTVHASWSPGSLRSARRREFEVACNWKAFSEVFNEYYHISYVHPSSIDGIYNHLDEPDVVIDHFATQFGTTSGTGGLLKDSQDDTLPMIPGLEGRDLAGTRYSWLFPNVMFAAGSEAMWMYEVYPIAPDRTLVAQTVCFPESTIELHDFEYKAELYYERFDAALEEDIPMLEQQQRGLGSPFAKQGRFSYLEPSVTSFACWYSARLSG
jgi:phenylpropionate dioxygenase-like ring-hydroxylating dioxygenase large terminal subunit